MLRRRLPFGRRLDVARAIVRRSEGGKDYAASGLADLRNHGSLPEDGFRLLIEDVKNAAKVEREVTLSEVADLAILREAQRELGIKSK